MVAFDFPNSPTPGTVANGYTFDGEKWLLPAAEGSSDVPDATTAGYLLQTNGAGSASTWEGFIQSGTGAVTRTWRSKARDIVSVEDFRAAGDPDDTLSFQRALNTGKTVMALGPVYNIAGNLVVNLAVTKNLCLIGGGPGVTQILFNGSGILLHAYVADSASLGIYMTTPPSTIVKGFTIRKNGSGSSDTGIKIELLDGPMVGNVEVYWREVSDIQFLPGPSGTASNFAVCIEWVNPTFTTTRQISMRSVSNAGDAVRFSGTRPCGDNFIHDLKAVDCDTVVNVTSTNMEGLYISQVAGVFVAKGIVWNPPTPKPLLQVCGCHFNIGAAGGIGIWCGVNTLVVSDTAIYLGATGTFGIYLEPASSTATLPQFSGVSVAKTGGAGATGLFLGAHADNVLVSGLTFYGIDVGINNGNTSPAVIAMDDIQFVSVPTQVTGNWKPPSLFMEETTRAAIGSAANAINTTGKYRGKILMVPDGANPGLYWSTGAGATSAWFLIHNFATTIVPA